MAKLPFSTARLEKYYAWWWNTFTSMMRTAGDKPDVYLVVVRSRKRRIWWLHAWSLSAVAARVSYGRQCEYQRPFAGTDVQLIQMRHVPDKHHGKYVVKDVVASIIIASREGGGK